MEAGCRWPRGAWLGLVGCFAVLGACGGDDAKDTDDADGEQAASTCAADQTWVKVADPILEKSCRTCHSAATAEALGDGHEFTNEAQVREHGHEMYELVESGEMPKGSKLAEADKKALLDWLECSGAASSSGEHQH